TLPRRRSRRSTQPRKSSRQALRSASSNCRGERFAPSRVMRRATIGSGAFLGALTSVAALAVLALGHAAWGLPFVPFDVFEVIVGALPGGLLTMLIDAMVAAIGGLGIGPTASVAKLAEQASAVAMFVLGSAILGAIVAAFAGSRRRAVIAGLVAAAVWIAAAAGATAARGELTLGGMVWIAVVGI